MTGYGTTLTVRRQARNSDGDLAGPAAEITTHGWRFEPATSESTDGGRGTREAAATTLRGYTRDAGVDVGAGDQALLDGDPKPWRVVGDPERWTDPAGHPVGGAVVTLQRTKG